MKTQRLPRMLLVLLGSIATCLAAVAQDAAKPAADAPKKDVISSYRIQPKPGQTAALEAALAAHAQKFHKGDQAWRVSEIMSGPDGGMYHIVEGPTSWTALDDRGDLGAEHMKDYETNVAPHVEKSSPDTYAVYQKALSTVAATAWSNKVLIAHLEVKPGRGGETYDSLKKWKAIYEKLGLNVAVWHSAFSGENSYALAFRLKHGLKDFDEQSPKFRKVCDDLYGPNEFGRLMQADTDNLSKIWQELIELKPELGSK